ncbi:MAG: transposase, partial [Deltaproteobacteria bacterium]|nr:transposase [Deltaproteobacteria bacterium]
EEQQRALELIVAGLDRAAVAQASGCTTESLRRWYNAAKAAGTLPQPSAHGPAGKAPRPPSAAMAVAPVLAPEAAVQPSDVGAPASSAPKDPGYGLADYEVAAILDLKKKHLSMGPAQIRTQLKRFKGWRISIKAIARVLRRAGYEAVHLSGRAVGEEPVRRFEAPFRNALWQLDYTDLRIGPELRYLLVIEDDFSRFVVGHTLAEGPTTEVATAVMREAVRRHGKPELVYSDRGAAFTAWRDITAFESYLEAELIDHSLRRAHHPRGGGKIESVIATVQRELWGVRHFESIEEAEAALAEFFAHYNHRRAHMGIGGLTPADRFFGRWPEVAAEVDALSRRRQGALAASQDRRLFHEPLPASERTHVLELVFTGDQAELRLLGRRVRLGPVET